MIAYFYICFLNRKKKYAISFGVLILFALMILILHPSESESYYRLYPNDYINLEVMMLKLLRMMLPMLILILAMDHDALYLKPLIVYHHRLKVGMTKYLFYCMLVIWLYAIVIALLLGVSYYFYARTILSVKLIVDLLLDGLIFLTFVLYLVRDQTKALTVLIVLVFMGCALLYEDVQVEMFYYLLPLYHEEMIGTKNIILIKICYLMLLMLLNFGKNTTEDL